MNADPLSMAAHRLLVVAPHPDDETLGCGGVIAAFAAAGRAVCTVIVTDGGASHRNSPGWPRPRLAAQRRREVAEAIRLLGAGDQPVHHLDLADADMPLEGEAAHAAALAQFAEILRSFAPDLVLLPWRRDPHRDHRDSWHLAQAALSASGLEPATLEYAIWLDELGAPGDAPRDGEADRVAFDISPYAAVKRAAVEAHASQVSALIDDDPTGFRLSPETIDRLCGATEAYLRPCR
jgi:LmbE family N-acetylglucosaminyl deacetylase